MGTVFSGTAVSAERDDNPPAVFSAIRQGWYRGGLQPRPSVADIARMQEYYANHADDPETQFWFAVLGSKRLLSTNTSPIDLLSASAKQGNARAMAYLGWAYLTGDGVAPDARRATELLDAALAKGESEAAVRYARAYADGCKAFAADGDTAENFARRALEMGDNRGHFVLAQCLQKYHHDLPGAFAELLRGAEGGDTDAICGLADAYRGGKGTPSDPMKAMRWMQKVAEIGVPSMQRDLAICLIKGYGGIVFDDQNRKTAHFLLERAAGADDRDAIRTLAYMYLEANGGYPYDPQESLRLLRRGVELKDPAADFELGILYVEGLVVPRDLDKAKQLMNDAASLGSDNARRYLLRLNAGPSTAATRDSGGLYLR